MGRSSATASGLGLILGVVLVLSTAACASVSGPESTPSSSATPTDAAASTAPENAVEVPDGNDPAACDDEEFTGAAMAPSQLADLGVPFYSCTHEETAVTGTDPLFVGEYVTNHELIIVEMAIADQFDASDWEVTDRSVEGDNAVTHAQKPGYSLVVAIGPTRMAPTDSSIHYTLRTQ